jgi:hypothetical protein
LSKCSFSGNLGSALGTCVFMNSATVSFSVTDSSFVLSQSSSIYFAANPESATFRCNCFSGSGFHIKSKPDSAIAIGVTGRLCFSNAANDAVQGISFSGIGDGSGSVSYSCSACCPGY